MLRILGLLGYVALTSVVLLEIGLRWLLPQPLPQPTGERRLYRATGAQNDDSLHPSDSTAPVPNSKCRLRS